MTPADSSSPPTPQSAGWYGFDGVRFSPDRHLLLVDGVRRDAQPLVLRLLTLLCEARGRVLSRPELFELLWPRQAIADESLTQLTARLREVLAPYSARVLTLRRVGLRLDGEISYQIEEDRAAPQPVSEQPVPAEPSPETLTHRAAPRQQWLPMLLLALTALVAVTVCWGPRTDPDAAIAGGRGLTERDLSAARADTADAVRRALRWELEGKRDEAQVLLELAHKNDTVSALPAIYLAFLAEATGRLKAAHDWQAQAELRLQGDPSMRLRVLLNLLDERSAAPTARALTNLRVAADSGADTPALRLGRAYTYLARVERAAALAELQGLDIGALDVQEMPGAIADLAALGDGDAAARALLAVQARLSPSAQWEIEARMAASRQQWPLAIAKIDAALGAAPDRRALLRLLTRAAFYRAQSGDYAAAREHFQAVLVSTDPAPTPLTLHNTYILLAGLPDASPQTVREHLLQAASNADANGIATGCWEIELVAGLQRLPADWVFKCQAPDATEEAQFPGFSALRAAFAARRRQDDASAAIELARARDAGIGATLFGPHALALAAQLGVPVGPAVPTDPPYPTWSRHVAYWQQRDLAGGGVMQPKRSQ